MSSLSSDTGRARRATIHQLPPELLSDIFNHNMPAYDPLAIFRECKGLEELRAQAPFRIAAVCRAWRETALADPRLWTTIIVPKRVPTDDLVPTCDTEALKLVEKVLPFLKYTSLLDSYHVPTWEACTLARIDTALTRSGNLPILLKFTLIEAAYVEVFKDLVLRLTAHAHRWRSFCATFSGQATFYVFLALMQHSAPELRAVKLQLGVRHLSIWSLQNTW